MNKILKTIFRSGLGIVFIIIGIYTLISNANDTSNARTTIATIAKIEEETRGSTNNFVYRYNVYVNYNFDEVEYENKWINLDSNSLKVGDTIKVKINKDNPSEPIYIAQSKLGLILVLVGSLIIIYDLVVEKLILKVIFK